MTKLWAKMVDTDGDGNLEAIQLHDEDPTGLWHPDFLAAWQEVPADTCVGDVLETSTQKWWKGADWLDKKLADCPPPQTVPATPVNKNKGNVVSVRIKEAGENYEIGSVRNQYDIGDGEGLVVTATFDETGGCSNVEIHGRGYSYEVGQTFKISEGFGPDMNRRNPTYAIIEITEVYDAEDAVVVNKISTNQE